MGGALEQHSGWVSLHVCSKQRIGSKGQALPTFQKITVFMLIVCLMLGGLGRY